MRRRTFGILLILIGCIIIGIAFYIRYMGERKQKELLAEYERVLYEIGQYNIEDNGAASSRDETDAVAVDNNLENNPEEVKSVVENNKAIAILEIPRIELTVAVVQGTEPKDLKYAVGHFENTAMPGESGNFCVAGHRSYTYSEYFNRLDELEKGDTIIAKTEKGTFEYEVYEKMVVEPTEVAVLEPTKEATITLVTCTPIRVATHRLIIKGRLMQ
ncbi:class D sortase [Clostridium thermarum]|uniref:class D sortase n=1 Tax=Clostridium thermarum TaxID=1716543 RepID=UPI001FABBD01|nr:class D sortase [Clostridium thermarum]